MHKFTLQEAKELMEKLDNLIPDEWEGFYMFRVPNDIPGKAMILAHQHRGADPVLASLQVVCNAFIEDRPPLPAALHVVNNFPFGEPNRENILSSLEDELISIFKKGNNQS